MPAFSLHSSFLLTTIARLFLIVIVLMNIQQPSSHDGFEISDRAWLINSRGIAKKIKNGTVPSREQLKDWGADANKECPNCHHNIDNSDVS